MLLAASILLTGCSGTEEYSSADGTAEAQTSHSTATSGGGETTTSDSQQDDKADEKQPVIADTSEVVTGTEATNSTESADNTEQADTTEVSDSGASRQTQEAQAPVDGSDTVVQTSASTTTKQEGSKPVVTTTKATTTTAKPATQKPAENTTGLTEEGKGTEGTASTGDYNYGEALQKAILFYELQRSGDIDEATARTNWRGDSGMNDGADAGLDLTGGLYDAGDNVKFNLPMAYTSSVLAWSVYEDRDAYEKSGQLEYILDTIKWVNDYLIKCHPEDDVYYYQVGNGSADHAWWGAAEVMQMDRPSYKVTVNSPGSAVVAEAAASLAACAVVFEDVDPAYSKKCLTHAKQLYDFAERTKSDSGYTAANGFYNSWSGFNDELAWAGAWLYIATGDNSWLNKAETYIKSASCDYKWTMCWDDVSIGAATLLAKLTGKQTYKDIVEKNLDWWTTGTNGERISYTPKGLAWLDGWGSLRYATTSAFVAAVYSEWDGCPSAKRETYTKFYESQINYALGSSGRSYVVGYGENPPQHPHHRTAQGSWADNMNEPNYHRHTLYGALVGGPNGSDGYTDTVSDYNCNEVACDYNAGFVGVLAKMYDKYGGKTIKDFGAIEQVGEELFVEYRTNAQGNGFTEIKALIYNHTSWPARVTDELELRYYMDLSEVYDAGGSAADLTVTTNYSEGGKSGGIYCHNEKNHIYYVAIDFSGTKIYPGGQSAHKKEVQFRITSKNGVWDPSNDPSYQQLIGTNGSSEVRAVNMALFDGSELVFGTEPDGKSVIAPKPVGTTAGGSNNGGATTTTRQQSAALPQNPTAEDNGVAVSVQQQSTSGMGNTIQFTLDMTNNTGAPIDLGKLEVDYYFTSDGSGDLCFWCDHAATNGTGYMALTDSVSGAFSSAKGANSDTKCAVKFSGGSLAAGDSMTVQVRITRADWSDFDLGNDYSAGNAEHIVILKGGSPIFGQKP